MEVLGAVLATVAIHGAGESSRPWTPEAFSTTDAAGRTASDEATCDSGRAALPPPRAASAAGALPASRPRCRSGVELELQLVNTHDYDLAPYAEDMLRLMAQTPLPGSGGARDDLEHDRDLDRRLPLGAATCWRSSRRSATRW